MTHDTDSVPARPVTLTAEDVHNLLSLIDALSEAAEGDSNDAEIDAGHALAGDLLAMLTLTPAGRIRYMTKDDGTEA
jgi:hypothetical protein